MFEPSSRAESNSSSETSRSSALVKVSFVPESRTQTRSPSFSMLSSKSERLVESVSRISTRPRNYTWAELMARVFEVDVLECPECGSAMRILAAIHPPEATRAILDCLGLPTRAPPVRPAEPDTTVERGEWL